VVLQLKYMAYWSGCFFFQSIRIVLPEPDAVVRYAGSPHLRVSSIVPTPALAAAVSRIHRRRAISLRRAAGG
jgi:hypothetical protein